MQTRPDPAAPMPVRAVIRAGLPLIVVAAALDGAFAFFVVAVQALLPVTLGAGPGTPGFALGIYGATRVLLQMPGGVLARRVGAGRLTFAATAAGMVALGLTALATAEWQVYALTFVYGAATALVWPALFLLAGDETSDQRGTLLGVLTFCALGGMGAGIVLGALSIDLLPGRVMAALAAVMLLAGGAGALPLLRRRPTADLARAGADGAAARVARPAARALWTLVPALALQGIGLSMLLPLLRLFAVDQVGLPLRDLVLLGIPAGGLAAVAMLPAGRLSDRVGRAPLIAAGSALAAGGVLLLSGADSRWLVAVGAIPLAVGYAVSAPALGAAIADLSDDAGRNVGLALTVQGIALAVGPALTGLLVADGAAPAMRVAAGMWLGAALVAAVPLRRPRSRVLALGRDDG